jgi:integrase
VARMAALCHSRNQEFVLSSSSLPLMYSLNQPRPPSHSFKLPDGTTSERLDSGLSPRTVQYVHTTLNKALSQAVRDGLIPRNAVASVKAPRPTREEIRPLDREQVRALFDAASDHRLEVLYILAVTAGLRQGELLALRWEDIDLEAGKLKVRRTLSEARSGRIFEAPKSGKGRSIRLRRP